MAEPPARPRVLVTNDDGVHAPGILALAVAAVAHGLDVVVAAPAEEASGMSAALTAVTDGGRVVLERTGLPGLAAPAYAVAASPAYIVVLAGAGAFGPPPDLVLSGINRGANAGLAVLHSGTVGAALTAGNAGARALAVSLDVLNPQAGAAASGGAALTADRDADAARHWDTAAALARGLFDELTAAAPGTVLNLNVPDRPAAAVAGLRRAGLASLGQTQMGVDDTGDGWVRAVVRRSDGHPAPGTDVAELARGWATVTPLRPVTAADGG